MKPGKRPITHRNPNTTVIMSKKPNVPKSPIPIYETADNTIENQDMEDREKNKYQEKNKKGRRRGASMVQRGLLSPSNGHVSYESKVGWDRPI